MPNPTIGQYVKNYGFNYPVYEIESGIFVILPKLEINNAVLCGWENHWEQPPRKIPEKLIELLKKYDEFDIYYSENSVLITKSKILISYSPLEVEVACEIFSALE